MSSLCVYCRRIPREFFTAYEDREIGEGKESSPFDCPEPYIVELHPSRASLTAAALEGCPLCTLILRSNEIATSESGGMASQFYGDGVISVRCGAPYDPETISVICGSVELARLLFTVIPEWWDASAKARSDVEVVKAWLKACDESHPNCQLPRQAFVPTRLIDLGPVDGNQVPRIQFGTNLKSQKIDYVALSYCWGTSMPELVKTTTQNIDDRFRKGFPAEICPPTIKDAFNFTRALGLRYIWIDVLCILQDSERDWTTQSTKMGLVYSSAYCTLAASASPDTNSGLPFYIFTNTLNSDNAIITFRSNDGGKPERVCISVRGWNRTADAQMASDPLQKRGWTVQERHLSYRVVHFSHENLLWECRQARSSTHLPWCPWSPLTSRNRRFFDGDKEALQKHLDGGGWGRLIWDYSKRALTYERDKFYAIAGLVEVVDAVLACGDQYLAGL